MKPPRLKFLIALLVMIGLMVGIEGLVRCEGLGQWTLGVLTCFFTAHLLSIPHNSGRYWAAFVALGLILLAAYKVGALFGWAGIPHSKEIPVFLGIGIPVLLSLLGMEIVALSIHPTVCDFFDNLETKGEGE
jgi:hypothetical protein